jgi:uncharacterized protein
VNSGIDAIMQHLARSPADAAAIEEAARAAQESEQGQGGIPVGGLIWLGILLFFFILPAFRGGGRRRRYRGAGGDVADVVGNIILWEAGKAIMGGLSDRDGGGFGGGGFGGGGGGFGGFGGGMSGGGGASGGW